MYIKIAIDFLIALQIFESFLTEYCSVNKALSGIMSITNSLVTCDFKTNNICGLSCHGFASYCKKKKICSGLK